MSLKFSLHVKELDNPYLVAYERILKRYGTGCCPKEPQDRGEHWCVPIEAYTPSRIVDEKTGTERILTFHLDNIGELWIGKSNLKIVHPPTSGSIRRTILLKKSEIRREIEKDLVKVIGDPELRIKFGKLKFALFGLQPIYRTIINLLDEKYPIYADLAPNYLEQVDLIIKLGYASYTSEQPTKLVPTNKLYGLYNQTKSVTETAEIFLGLILANFYEYLAETMRIIHFVPYIRVSTSYYGDAIQFGKLISITESRLRRNLHEYYRGAPQLTLAKSLGTTTAINELIEADVLKHDGSYITGRDEIFDRLISVREELPMTEEPYTS